MPRNPSGTAYSKPNTFGLNPPEVISSSKMNANFDDIGTELVNSLPRDGRAAMTGPIRAVAGVDAQPGYSFANDPDTGIRWETSGSFSFVSNGTDVITVTPDGIELDKPETLIGIGDFYDTIRALDARFLRRDGALYPKADYPNLAALIEAKYGALTDNVTWSNLASGAVALNRAVISSATKLLVVEDDGTNTKIRISTDNGDNWSLAATILNFRGYCITFGAGIYLLGNAAAGNVSTSSDGISWSAPATLTGFGTEAPTGVAYGAGLFAAVGTGGKIATSPDGVTWTARTSGTTQPLFNVTFANGVFVAVGGSGTILTSTDGINWTARTSGVTTLLRAVAYGAGLYVIIGGGGVILTSTNLASWTSRSSGTTKDLNAIAYSSSGFLLAGDTGTVRISANGTSWTSPDGTGTSSSFQGVSSDATNPAKYYVVGAAGATLLGVRTLPTQFRVPADKPDTGWIRALNELP